MADLYIPEFLTDEQVDGVYLQALKNTEARCIAASMDIAANPQNGEAVQVFEQMCRQKDALKKQRAEWEKHKKARKPVPEPKP